MAQDLVTLLGKAFSDRPEILAGLRSLLEQEAKPARVRKTLQDLAGYVLDLKQLANGEEKDTLAPGSKKRKFPGNDGASLPEVGGRVLFSGQETSFSIPVRKKLKLEGMNGGLRGVDTTGNTEMSIGWDNIEHIFCLPVPEKAKPQSNFVIIPQQKDPTADAIVWTASEVNPKTPDAGIIGPSDMAKILDKQMAKYGKKVVWPDEDEFSSQATKGAGKQYAVRTHRGSKEGYLFFLSPGVLWAFKKPLLFLPFTSITSISYTSVLQRTFNINIAVREPDNDGMDQEYEIEFAMVDQADFAGIDAYVKRHGLNDASLAAGRRAKKYNVNTPKGAATAGATAGSMDVDQNGDDEDEETELQKAERLLQDEEDEEEEDYVDDDDEEDVSSDGEDYEDGEDATAEGFEEEQEYDQEEGGYEDDDE